MSENFDDRLLGDYCLTSDSSRYSVDTIYHLLSQEAYWARGRSRETVVASLENSYPYGVVSPEGDLVAFLRVVTDSATFAWISDVFVVEQARGRGVGTWMVGEVTRHWLDHGVKRVLLATLDAHEVYAKVGFVPLANPERFMEIDRRLRF